VQSINSSAFLSRVFEDRVSDTVERITQICRALDIDTYCVQGASSNTPTEDAKEKIGRADFLVAICTRKDKLEGLDKYHTSTAVWQEIAIAKAMNKRVVCFLENGVLADGFAANMFTYQFLEDAENLKPRDLYNVTAAVHRTKLASATRTDDILQATGLNNFSVSTMVMRLALTDTRKGLAWDYVIERTYKFEAEHNVPLSHAAFCPQDTAAFTRAPRWQLEFFKNGSPIEPDVEAQEAPGRVTLLSRFDPPLTKGDSLFVRERYRYPYLAPIHTGQGVRQSIRVGANTFDAFDGAAVIHRIQHLKLIYSFPRLYVTKDLQPTVATFSYTLDHVNDEEVARLITENCFEMDTFDQRVRATLSVERPLYQYFYGLVWNLPEPDSLPSVIASEDVDWDD
jgi:hypothetical protein